MNSIENSKSVLTLLIKLEEEVGALYQLCACEFPEYADIWTPMAVEENRHADLLRTLEPAIMSGEITAPDQKLDIYALQMFFEHLLQQKKFVEQHQLPIHTVVSMALNLEAGLIERDFITHFEGEAPELPPVVAALTSETSDHVTRLKKLKEILSS